MTTGERFSQDPGAGANINSLVETYEECTSFVPLTMIVDLAEQISSENFAKVSHRLGWDQLATEYPELPGLVASAQAKRAQDAA